MTKLYIVVNDTTGQPLTPALSMRDALAEQARLGADWTRVQGAAAAEVAPSEQALVATSDPRVFYDRSGDDFVIYGPGRQMAGWADTFERAVVVADELHHHPAQPAAAALDRDELVETLQLLADSSARPQDYKAAIKAVRAGATWQALGGGWVEVQRPGSEAHLSHRDACDCKSTAGGCLHRAIAHAATFNEAAQLAAA